MTITFPGRYAKFLTALAGQALVYAQYTYGNGSKWVTVATALAGALGVLAVPNTPKPAPPFVTNLPSVTTTGPPPVTGP